MNQLPGGNKRFPSIPKPNSAKLNNDISKVPLSNEFESKEAKNMKEKYDILKIEYTKLQNQFKLYKLQTMTQINKINYDKNNEINNLKKEKEEMQIQNQALEKNYSNLNNEFQKIQAENKYLKDLLNNTNIDKNHTEQLKQNNEKINKVSDYKQNNNFHYQPPENENIINNDQQNISTILPPCIKNSSNTNFPVFTPKEKTFYLFFPEKTQPNYNKSLKNDVIYGAQDAIDVQRFHYYPNSKNIYTFIGFSNENICKSWISNFTTRNISYDKKVYVYPYNKIEQ